jgi:hypothetical protein
MARRPRAPALAHRAASSLIPATRAAVEGRAALKTQALGCFQIIQGMRRDADTSPLCIGFGVFRLALRHHSETMALLSGGWQVRRSQERSSSSLGAQWPLVPTRANGEIRDDTGRTLKVPVPYEYDASVA